MHLFYESGYINWFCYIVIKTRSKEFFPVSFHGKGGQSDNGYIIISRLVFYDTCGIYTIHPREFYIHQDQIIMFFFNHFYRFFPINCLGYDKIQCLQDFKDKFHIEWIVFHNKDFRHKHTFFVLPAFYIIIHLRHLIHNFLFCC